jgi:hypothetical protein
MRLAAPVAIQAICDYLRHTPHNFELVRMVLYPDEAPEGYSMYNNALSDYLAANDETAVA